MSVSNIPAWHWNYRLPSFCFISKHCIMSNNLRVIALSQGAYAFIYLFILFGNYWMSVLCQVVGQALEMSPWMRQKLLLLGLRGYSINTRKGGRGLFSGIRSHGNDLLGPSVYTARMKHRYYREWQPEPSTLGDKSRQTLMPRLSIHISSIPF